MKKSFVLSRLSLAISLCYVSQFSYADIQTANSNTQVSRQQGVEIINIATPSGSGLSHNQYQKFNVERAGAVLNNAQQTVQSQLAGTVSANPKLHNSAAKIILNEVVSRNPSLLLGQQEIVGQRADYVLANPNGISCDGCGFINTPRASLVVGQAEVIAGKLRDYNVNNNNTLTTKGNITAEDLDLLAPTVNISGNIKAKKLNVVLGKNQFERTDNGDLSISVLPQDQSIIDGKVDGSIQAGRIRIHSTHKDSTLNINGADLQAKEVAITSDKAKIDGCITQNNENKVTHSVENYRVQITNNHTVSVQNYKKAKIIADNVVLGANHSLIVNGAEIKAKNIDIIAGSAILSPQITENITTTLIHRHKIFTIQYGNEEQRIQDAMIHRTEIIADNLKVVAKEGQITGQAVKIDAHNLILHGHEGINFNGSVIKHLHASTVEEAGVAQVRKSFNSSESDTQDYVASELNVKGNTMLSSDKGNIHLTGVVSRIDGDALINTSNKVIFDTEKTENNHKVGEHEKILGGLFGATDKTKNEKQTIENGSDLITGGMLFIDGRSGVQISGSRVLAAKGGLVKADKGNLLIDSVQNSQALETNDRKGTIFNITQARKERYTNNITSQGAVVKSESNLKLIGKDFDAIGSQIIANGFLDVAMRGHINVKGAENIRLERELDSGFGWTTKIDKPKITINDKLLINSSLATLDQLLIGEKNPQQTLQGFFDNLRKNISFEQAATVGLGFHKTQQTTNNVTHTASQLNGRTVHLNANNLNVLGSQVNATEGDLVVKAKAINTAAQIDQSIIDKKDTQGGIHDTIKVSQKGITNTLSVGVTHNNEQHRENKAQGSQLSAKKDIQLNADSIKHQGSDLVAGRNVVEKAKSIEHITADNQQADNNQKVNVGIDLTMGVDTSKTLSGTLVIKAEGGKANNITHTAKTTNIKAGNDVSVGATELVDQATHYQSDNKVVLTSDKHSLLAVNNSKHKDKLDAGVNIALSADSKDLHTVNVAVKVGGKFQTESASESKAQKSVIQSKDIVINTGKLVSQTDMLATGNINITADQANFTQAQNSNKGKGGGFKLDVATGALAVPTVGGAIPSIDVNLGVNGHSKQENQTVTNTIKANNVVVNVKKSLNIQGTNLQGNTSLSADKITLAAGYSNKQNVDVNLGIGVRVGANTSSAALNTNLGVQNEDSTLHAATSVDGQHISLRSQKGISAEGVNVNSKNLVLDAGKGDLNLVSTTDSIKKTGVSTALSLNGDVKEHNWNTNGGSASLSVDVVRNQIQHGTQIKSDKVRYSAQSSTFQGNVIDANQISGSIAGDIHKQDLVNKTNEVSLSLSASGSKKTTGYSSGRWLESAKQDWDNGTIAGVSAGIKGNLTINQNDSSSGAHKALNANLDLSTNIKQMLQNQHKIINVKKM